MARQLCLILPLLLASVVEAAVLQIHLVQGDGTVHQPGSRVQTPLVVKITGETGQTVDGALVSFRLPADGPGGLFTNGLTTDIVRTGPGGEAAMPPVCWNTTPGSFEIRVTASKDGARAGLLVSQSLGEARTSMVTVHPGAASARPRRKWILLVAGVAAGSLAAGMAVAKKPETSTANGPSPPGLSVGTPSITIGGPK